MESGSEWVQLRHSEVTALLRGREIRVQGSSSRDSPSVESKEV
jgi:hypothetical protein